MVATLTPLEQAVPVEGAVHVVKSGMELSIIELFKGGQFLILCFLMSLSKEDTELHRLQFSLSVHGGL